MNRSQIRAPTLALIATARWCVEHLHPDRLDFGPAFQLYMGDFEGDAVSGRLTAAGKWAHLSACVEAQKHGGGLPVDIFRVLAADCGKADRKALKVLWPRSGDMRWNRGSLKTWLARLHTKLSQGRKSHGAGGDGDVRAEALARVNGLSQVDSGECGPCNRSVTGSGDAIQASADPVTDPESACNRPPLPSSSSSSSSSSTAQGPSPETRTTRARACAREAPGGEDAPERPGGDLDPCACLCADPNCERCKPTREALYGGGDADAPVSTYALTVYQAHLDTGKAEEKWSGPQHADLDVAEEWEAAGVHVDTACRVIAEVGEKWKKRAGPIRSLAAYRPAMRTAIDLARYNASIMGEKRAKAEADQAWLEEHRAVIQAQEEADQQKANAEKERQKRAEKEAAARRAEEIHEIREATARRHAGRADDEPSPNLDTARRRALEAIGGAA